MAVAAGILGVLGSVVSTISGIGEAQYRASVADMNAQIARENANRAIERSQVEQQDQDAKSLALLGEQEAVQSASGLSLTGKSFVLTRKSARELARRDALNVIQGGQIEAYNYKVEAANQEAQAGADRAAGTAGLLEGFLGATKSLVGMSSSLNDPNRYGAPRSLLT